MVILFQKRFWESLGEHTMLGATYKLYHSTKDGVTTLLSIRDNHGEMTMFDIDEYPNVTYAPWLVAYDRYGSRARELQAAV